MPPKVNPMKRLKKRQRGVRTILKTITAMDKEATKYVNPCSPWGHRED